MILDFADKETESVWHGERSRRLPGSIQDIARRKLRMLNNAQTLEYLRIPSANRLEALKGGRKGQHCIRINDQADLLQMERRQLQRSRDCRLPLTEECVMAKLKNIHPGEILLEEFLLPMGVSQNALARAISVPPRRINEIVLGKRGITADTALRLSRAFGNSEGFWMGLQADYDLEETRKRIDSALKNVERLAA